MDELLTHGNLDVQHHIGQRREQGDSTVVKRVFLDVLLPVVLRMTTIISSK